MSGGRVQACFPPLPLKGRIRRPLTRCQHRRQSSLSVTSPGYALPTSVIRIMKKDSTEEARWECQVVRLATVVREGETGV
jgi:hypothetical protein